MRTLLKPLACVIALGCALATPCSRASDTTNPDGSIKVTNFGGDFSRFTVLTTGDLNDNNNTVTGPSSIVGNVGVAGHGNYTMSDGTLNGDLYMNSFGTVKLSGPAKITGRRHGIHETAPGDDATDQTALLSNALSGAQYLSNQAVIDTNTGSYTVTGSFNGMTENGNQNVTLMGSGHIVLNLQDFVMTGGTFTLSGTAMTSYIINVSRNFSLNNAKIVLGGQLTASHVLFNITGKGSDVTLQQGTSMQGILLAYQRKVNLSGGKVFGRVIAEQLALTSGGQVISQ
jgi:hypothetical protein